MVEISDSDKALLLNALNKGEAVLILGAGASANCTIPPKGEKVPQGRELAQLLATEAGMSYCGESLPIVLGAVRGHKIGPAKFDRILTASFTKVDPSPELKQLMDYTWRRLYTWNIDDAIENIREGVQIRRYFNGLIDKVVQYEGHEYLHVVHLHGEALKPGAGLIFSENEYNARLIRDDHDWYRAAIADYIGYTPIFIGSRLEEPILSAELDRARPHKDSSLGAAFLVTPDNFTAIELANFKARDINIIRATLEEFVAWLRTITGKVTPVEVAETNNEFTRELTSAIEVTRSDVDVAETIVVHRQADTKRDLNAYGPEELRKAARKFLEGAPPSWRIAATNVPVWLTNTSKLYEAMKSAIQDGTRAFVVYGQSGSGKTTATLQAMVRYLDENPTSAIYELRPDTPSLLAALRLLHRMNPDRHVIIFAGDAFVWGDSLAEDILSFPSGKMTLILGARSGEWSRHIKRRIGEISRTFQFERFIAADYDPLIGRLLEYVPAPAFKRLDPSDRREKLQSSRDQLLIALRETTESELFTNVITKEFKNLPDHSSQLLLLLVTVPTIARTGVSESMAREAFGKLLPDQNFNNALLALDGIVQRDNDGRLIARHELYVRHIIENVADFEDVINTIVELLRTFTKFKLPIVKTVERRDGILFKFLLNHNFNKEISLHRGLMTKAQRIYSTFEVEFQLEGHYWLQYGQFLVEMHELERALNALSKSIQAYPNNPFAIHAYADVQLRVARQRDTYDAVTVELIGDAVRSLEELHLKQTAEFDQYPMVTLAEKHVGALIKHGKIIEAKSFASRYFRQLDEMAKRGNEKAIKARERLAHFVTHSRW